jgi:hypothetical protein
MRYVRDARPTLIDLHTLLRHPPAPTLAQMVGTSASRGAGPALRGEDERIDGGALEMLYWAAVAVVIAITAGVLCYAAGTPTLLAVTTLVAYLFAALACVLATVALLRVRLAARRRSEPPMPRSPALRARMRAARR